jgi:hypothetical protein
LTGQPQPLAGFLPIGPPGAGHRADISCRRRATNSDRCSCRSHETERIPGVDLDEAFRWYGCQCQPRHTVRTDISCPRTFAARIGTGPPAHSSNRSVIHRWCPVVSQAGTGTAPGTSSRHGRLPGPALNKALPVMV